MPASVKVAAPMAGNQKNNTEEGKVRDGVEAEGDRHEWVMVL